MIYRSIRDPFSLRFNPLQPPRSPFGDRYKFYSIDIDLDLSDLDPRERERELSRVPFMTEK